MTTTLNFRTLDLNLLRVFDVVMAERNLTRAAERLSLTQPAVSNALKRLRDSVGEDLLTRSAHGVVPTPRAEALWPEVRSALGRLRSALAPGEFDPQADPASFRIAMADATAALFMPPLVAQIEQSGARANLRSLPLTTRDPSTSSWQCRRVETKSPYLPAPCRICHQADRSKITRTISNRTNAKTKANIPPPEKVANHGRSRPER